MRSVLKYFLKCVIRIVIPPLAQQNNAGSHIHVSFLLKHPLSKGTYNFNTDNDTFNVNSPSNGTIIVLTAEVSCIKICVQNDHIHRLKIFVVYVRVWWITETKNKQTKMFS